MTRVSAPSRLHFGLLNAGDVPGRPRFGGCGLMIDRPGVCVGVEPAADWSATGPSAERALAVARRASATPVRVVVEGCPPEHVGLGVGTSLGLAVAKAIRPELPAVELARLVGRGERSGVGLYGFDRGGFVVDAGRIGDGLPALAGVLRVPPGWRVAVFVPAADGTWHGLRERKAFDRPPASPDRHDALGRLLADELTPALAAADFRRFAAAVHEYNRRAGEPFAAAQGGVYTGRVATALVAAVRSLGFEGVGQSSWGPTVFAFVEDAAQGEYLTDVIWDRFAGLRTAEVVAPATTGARVE